MEPQDDGWGYRGRIMKYYLAIDLGASSGRHVIGYKDKDGIKLVEIYRFRTLMDDSADGLVWDIPRLYSEILFGIRKAFREYGSIKSLSIDTWGVDYVLMNGEKEITPYYAYRNARCQKAANRLHKEMKFRELYQKTGIQYAPFNTIYQLFDDKEKGRLDDATDYLMLPSYFTYKLTGVKTHEFTNESTTGLLNAEKGDYDLEIIDRLGLPRNLFGKIMQPGSYVGELLPEIREKVGGNCRVVLCASHDTASAFESIDVPSDAVILSSGTWSLLGIKNDAPIVNEESLKNNYTNEGGVGYIRFLKNIMGMYLSNCLLKEIKMSLPTMVEGLSASSYKEVFDVNDPSLSAPESMKEALLNLLKDNPPKSDIDPFVSIFRSLALSYKKAIEELERITKKNYSSIYIIGGGAKNEFLNNLIKEAAGLKVIAKPIEATSLGNIKMQMKGN